MTPSLAERILKIAEGKGPLRAYASYSPAYNPQDQDEGLQHILMNMLRAIKVRFAEQFRLVGFQIYDTGEPRSPQILVAEVKFQTDNRREIPHFTRDLDALLQRLTMDNKKATFMDVQYESPLNRLVVIGYDPEALCNYIRARMSSSPTEVKEVREREMMLQKKAMKNIQSGNMNKMRIQRAARRKMMQEQGY